MENVQKIDQIINKAGCSYEDARSALENNGWDMIDAIISLERAGKVNSAAEESAERAEEPAEFIPVVTAEVVNESSDDSRTAGDSGKAGNSKAKGSSKREFKLWKRIKSIMLNNRLVIIRSNGQQLANLPILVPVIALLAFFWATLALAVVGMIFGFRFHFEGEDLGKTNINSTMDKATDYAEKVRSDLAEKANGRQNSDN